MNKSNFQNTQRSVKRIKEVHGVSGAGFKMPELHIKTVLRDKEGNILDEKYQVGHSWTYNAWVAAFAMITDAPGYADLTGQTLPLGGLYGNSNIGLLLAVTTSPFTRNHATIFAANGFYNNAANNTFGIQVGTSNEPFHINDFALWGLIAHGSSAGQFTYNAQVAPVVSYAANKYTITHTRLFNNNSGGSITVKEVGMAFYGNANLYNYPLMTRDVLDTPVAVPTGAQLTISVQMTSVDFSSIISEPNAYDVPLGTAGMGGYFIGSGYANVAGQIHLKYGLIVSPISGGEISSVQYKNARTDPPDAGDSNQYLGSLNMTALYALGADSSMAVACAAANTANLGGFNDWYIPSSHEFLNFITANNLTLPEAQRVTVNTGYWSSSRSSATQAYNGSTSLSYKENSLKIRLVRKILMSDWVAD